MECGNYNCPMWVFNEKGLCVCPGVPIKDTCGWKSPLILKTDGGAKVACCDGLDAQLAKTTITMFITFMQNKGVWPCTLEPCEFPRGLSAKKVLEMKDEFVAKICN